MKGLLVKDIRIMCSQKRFFLLVLFIAVIMNFSSNTTYVVYYLTFVCSFFAISSISYDEADNGYPFLFTMPVDRSIYVWEKYLFGVLLNLGSWLAGLCICFVFQAAGGNLPDFVDSIAILALMIPAMLVFNAVIFPLLFKFGSERGRIVTLCVLGIAFVAGYVLSQKMDLLELIRVISGYPVAVLAFFIVTVTAVLMTISCAASIVIMRKKEL